MLKFHKANAQSAYIAYTETYAFQVRKHPGERDWRVTVWTLGRTAGAPDLGVPPTVYVDREVARARVETKSLGYGVAQAYEALGDDYVGVVSRMTRAITMAYDDDKVLSEVRESLAQMRRGEVTEA